MSRSIVCKQRMRDLKLSLSTFLHQPSTFQNPQVTYVCRDLGRWSYLTFCLSAVSWLTL